MSAGPPQPLRVLYVEDAFDQALLVKAILQSSGHYQVTHAQDGEYAATLAREREWDLLITDLNLPGLDGFELCRIAKQVHPELPVLAITGYTGAHYQEQAFRAGATELLTKPIEKADFLAKVQELTGSGAAAASQRVNVLAVGGLPGDVEMGCGGTLLVHGQEGATVTIMPLCRDELDPAGAGLEAARRSAQALGANLILDDMALDDTQRRMALVERVVRDLAAQVVYVPALDDGHAARREAFRIAKACTTTVPRVLGYQTATTGVDFRPTFFQDVGEVLVDKMEALTCYQEAGLPRPDLSPRMAQAYARYWGRLERFTEVEPFEVIRG